LNTNNRRRNKNSNSD